MGHNTLEKWRTNQEITLMRNHLLPKNWWWRETSEFKFIVNWRMRHQFSSVQSLSRVRLFATPWTTAHQASLSITITPEVHSNSCPLSQWCHPTISSFVFPFSSCLQSFLASGSFQWVSSLHQVAKGSELQLQYQSFQWTFRVDFL